MVTREHVVIGEPVPGVAMSERFDHRKLVHHLGDGWQLITDARTGDVGRHLGEWSAHA